MPFFYTLLRQYSKGFECFMQVKNLRVKEYVFNWLTQLGKLSPSTINNLSDEFIVSSIKQLLAMDTQKTY